MIAAIEYWIVASVIVGGSVWITLWIIEFFFR